MENTLYYVEKWGKQIYVLSGYKTGTNKDYYFKKYNGTRYLVEKVITEYEFFEAVRNGWHNSK